MRRSGFTLIELLVVISIIAILAAILFPVFARLKDRAISTQCLSGVKQLAHAHTMYLDDNDGFVPPIPYSSTPAPGDPEQLVFTDRMVRCLDPYVKDANIWYCPALPKNAIASQHKTNFWMNHWLSDSQSPLVNGTTISLRYVGSCPKPSSVWVLTEGSTGGANRKFPHREGLNAAYLDGHAAWVSGQCYFGTCAHPKWVYGTRPVKSCEKFFWGWDNNLHME